MEAFGLPLHGVAFLFSFCPPPPGGTEAPMMASWPLSARAAHGVIAIMKDEFGNPIDATEKTKSRLAFSCGINPVETIG